MAEYYRLENNELGVCLECGLLIAGAEKGCVDYTTDALHELSSTQLQKLLDIYYIAYQVQHYSYFNLPDVEIVRNLLMLGHYLQHKKAKKYMRSTTQIKDFLATNFFVPQQIFTGLSIVTILRETHVQMQHDLLLQYIQEVYDAYETYQAALAEL